MICKTGRLFAQVLLTAAVLAATASAQDAPAPVRLTLRDAVERGLRSNLRVLAGQTRIGEAAGTSERRKSALYPRVRGELGASLQNRNLRAFGLSFPGAPAVIDPFSNYDLRVYAEQPVFDLQSRRTWKASELQEQAVREDLQDIRDTIVRQVAALYLNAQGSAARARAAESRVATAEELYRLARERREAGVATGVEVLRAQVQLANERQRVLEACNAAQQALLVLARNIGMRPGTPLELAEPLEFRAVEEVAPAQALAESLSRRADYRSLEKQRAALVEQQRASHARALPKFAVGGHIGGLGRTLGDVRATGLLQGTISMSLFDRDRTGEQAELANRVQRLDHQMADLRLGIEQEIREALLQLESAAQEVRVAQEGEQLAGRELELARERFREGVAGNLEVVSAQDSLHRAQENTILALVRHSDARTALARALGGAEKAYQQDAGPR